jgi:AcrR family transcriptional regulator
MSGLSSERSFYNGEMPRVSAEHLAARRQQILDAARGCFARNGFHQTSMQDVIRAADLSVGAVYRYFPSKNDLVTAIAEQTVDEVAAVFDALAVETPPPSIVTVMQRATDLARANSGPDGALRMAIQIWSESLRDPTLAATVGKVYRRLRDVLVTFAERAMAAGALPADADPLAVGSVLFALLPGYAVQRVLIDEPPHEVFQAGLRTLLGDRTLSNDRAG